MSDDAADNDGYILVESRRTRRARKDDATECSHSYYHRAPLFQDQRLCMFLRV